MTMTSLTAGPIVHLLTPVDHDNDFSHSRLHCTLTDTGVTMTMTSLTAGPIVHLLTPV